MFNGNKFKLKTVSVLVYILKWLSFVTAIELLELMLELDAERRITAEQALAHPYLAQYADPTDEPVSLPYDQSFEDMDLPVEKWKGYYFSKYYLLQKFSAL